MRNIKERLAKLEAAMNPPSPPEIEWLTITPDMNVEQAGAIYRENLRRSNEHHRKYPDHYKAVDIQMTDEEAADCMRDILESFPRDHLMTNQRASNV